MPELEIFAQLRGKMRTEIILAKRCWLQVGGAAEYLFTPADAADLVKFRQICPPNIPIFPLGVGSNLLVRDGGIKGVVLRLGREFAQMQILENNRILVGAAALDVNLAQFACQHNIAGLEFLKGIPGTIGGALAMNAGAYGREISDVLESAQLVDATGNILNLSPQELNFSYRHSQPPTGAIFTSAILQGKAGNTEEIQTRMDEITKARSQTQPINSRTGGSTFQNPPQHKAWELIDQAGCRGLQIGGAQMSELHCNFLINTGNATAADLENLGEEVRRRVWENSKVQLEWEIKRVGQI